MANLVFTEMHASTFMCLSVCDSVGMRIGTRSRTSAARIGTKSYISSVAALRDCWMIFSFLCFLLLCNLYTMDYPLLTCLPLDFLAVWFQVLIPGLIQVLFVLLCMTLVCSLDYSPYCSSGFLCMIIALFLTTLLPHPWLTFPWMISVTILTMFLKSDPASLTFHLVSPCLSSLSWFHYIFWENRVAVVSPESPADS